jgi:hypothetical protein
MFREVSNCKGKTEKRKIHEWTTRENGIARKATGYLGLIQVQVLPERD